MRPTTLAALLCVALAGATSFALIAAPQAKAYSVNDLSNLGYSVLSDNKGGGCIEWSAGLPGYQRTVIGQDCWPTFQVRLDNYIASTLPALQAWQAAHAASVAAVPTRTVTVTQTVYDSAGGTFTITVTNPGLTVTAPPTTVTAPGETVTVPGPHDAVVVVQTVTGPTTTIDRYTTVTVAGAAPPPVTITETDTATETDWATTTRAVTVRQSAPKAPKRPARRTFRTG